MTTRTPVDARTYWTRGTVGLYRTGPRGTSPERWDGSAWVPHPGLLGDLLDGDTTLDETPAADAAARFPDAFPS